MPEATEDGGTATTRRAVLQAAGAGSMLGALSTLFSQGAAARHHSPTPADGNDDLFDVSRVDPDGVFSQSVASGGPTPSGAIVWTRVSEAAYEATTDVGLQVTPAPSRDAPNSAADFTSDATRRYRVPADALVAETDYTLTVDLDGELDADRFYFYRFVFDGDATATGRLRTLPEPDASPDRLKLAVASCNNYLHGYFGGFSHIAREDADLLVHLGDFIYEYAGSGSQPGRDIQLPSGKDVAFDLADFRHLHRTYRADRHMQAALERHTLVHTWDDHEIVNNRWWNYEMDAPETQSHPKGDDPEAMKQLYVEGIKALTEYLPFRVDYDPTADSLFDRFTLYRSVRFGDLGELFMTDERLYRSAPPEDAFGQRDLATPPSREADDADRTMLGNAQREWLVGGVTSTEATWKLWGNSVLNAALKATNAGQAGSFYINYDAWDGYEAERELIMGAFAREATRRGQALNLVTLTGDMHAYVAAYLKQDYKSLEKQGPFPGAAEDRVGVEFMAPGVTSDNLGATTPTPPDLEEDIAEAMVESQNPHVEWFNWSRYGYTIVELTDDHCIYTAYDVDRTADDAAAPKTLLRSYLVPEGDVELRELSSQGPTSVVNGVEEATGQEAPGAGDAPDAPASSVTDESTDPLDGIEERLRGEEP
ncbi:alkaline phosphatase D family protein [Halorarius litoreus]|uniref:alkaline phosphatase D family protein n=1 Tax=Halorarius litoreus TaxID=2962676 RepID=UPI0020CC2458|nr:alkaline phosphatase D family protein [Halorarius litoreus]